MSEADATTPTSPNASDLNAQAASWLERREAADWSMGDQAELEAWLAASEAHCTAFWRLETAWDQSQRLPALRLERRTTMGLTDERWRFWPIVLRGVAAAVILVSLGVAWTSLRSQKLAGELYATPVGGREVLALTDGSQIELNTNTAARVDVNAGRRLVTLIHGEAYFQIKHDAMHPFVVMARGRRITDLGTKFLVRDRGDTLEVALMEGRAQIEATDASGKTQIATLVPGDVAMSGSHSMSIVPRSQQELKTVQAWRQGELIFDHTTLAHAVAEFNRYNRVKLVIADRAAAEHQFGGTFPTNDLDDFTKLAQTVLGLHVENRGNEIVISR